MPEKNPLYDFKITNQVRQYQNRWQCRPLQPKERRKALKQTGRATNLILYQVYRNLGYTQEEAEKHSRY